MLIHVAIIANTLLGVTTLLFLTPRPCHTLPIIFSCLLCLGICNKSFALNLIIVILTAHTPNFTFFILYNYITNRLGV